MTGSNLLPTLKTDLKKKKEREAKKEGKREGKKEGRKYMWLQIFITSYLI